MFSTGSNVFTLLEYRLTSSFTTKQKMYEGYSLSCLIGSNDGRSTKLHAYILLGFSYLPSDGRSELACGYTCYNGELVMNPFSTFSTRLATRGSPLLSVIGIKTTPNYAILTCFLATGTLYLLPKPLRQRYSGLTVCPDTV